MVRRSPLLGEHTDELLSEILGYDQGRIDEARAAGAFSRAPRPAAAAADSRAPRSGAGAAAAD